ncbi:hypothetical protein FIA58_004355 [Flavobacterium jejuense]|uniref:Uncharacterized protein n=1 Tax=Flavobacterium jejuense TaxID=1544455 RepID=A0ABX0IM73_9FLAO|nr:hypothetical protein [Flavobacterium jejuense]NHN24902.1 hypothetical protein [Flavobacterium jejuense]
MKKIKLLFFGITSILIVSCEKNEDLENAQTSPSAVSETYISRRKANEVATVSKTAYSDWTVVTRNDLSNLGQFLNESFAKQRFNDRISINDVPKNVSVNDVKLGSGTNPNQGQNWVTERRFVGNGYSGAAGPYTNWQQVSGYAARVETNYTNTTQNLGGFVLYSSIRTVTSNWNVSATAGLKIAGKVGIPFVTEGSVEVSLSTTAGGGESKSTTFTENYRTPNINVAPGQSVRFVLEERWRPLNSTWSVPVNFRGYVGADYGKRVNGHYFWAIPASSYFWDFQNGSQKYTVSINEKSAHEIRVAAYYVN